MRVLLTVASVAVVALVAGSIGSSAQQCSSNVPVFVGSISQIFNGVTTPYTWVISPSSPSSITPTGTTSCKTAGYIEQFNSGGGCDATLATMTSSATSTGCNYVISDNVRVMTVALTCNSSTSGLSMGSTVPVNQNAAGKYEYSFQGTTAAVCTGSGGGGEPEKAPPCSGGCVFVILFFVGSALYVVGAVAWNYFKEGKRGVELAPHPQFWTMVPGLLKDGVFFTGRMITKPCRKDGDGSYTQV